MTETTTTPTENGDDAEVTPAADAWTIKRLLEWTTEYFKQVESASPRLEAEVLLADALECKRIELYTRFNEIPEEPGLGKYRAWVKRRWAGEPVAYLVGYKEFFSLRFAVDSNVLIPRPETEHAVLEVVEAAKLIERLSGPLTIVDVGTGSGCIAITVATQLKEAQIVATDISTGALGVASANAQTHGVDSRITFLEGDLLASVSQQPIHIIVSNPPYIGNKEEDTVDESVRKYEPSVALFGGDEGTEIIARLIDEAAGKLESGGFLIFETSPIVMDRCLELVNQNGSYEAPKVVKDLAKHPRIVVARKT